MLRPDAFLAAVYAASARGLPDPAFSVDALAATLATSRRQLARRLAALTGETPGTYLRRMRLAAAAARLADGATVAEAADAAGFASRSQFSRAFREAYGAPPGAFRARQTDTNDTPMSETGTAMSGTGTSDRRTLSRPALPPVPRPGADPLLAVATPDGRLGAVAVCP